MVANHDEEALGGLLVAKQEEAPSGRTWKSGLGLIAAFGLVAVSSWTVGRHSGPTTSGLAFENKAAERGVERWTPSQALRRDLAPAQQECPVPLHGFDHEARGCNAQGCLVNNHKYTTLDDAWAACGSTAHCSYILQWPGGGYYLRRANDPVTPIAGAKCMLYTCTGRKSDTYSLQRRLVDAFLRSKYSGQVGEVYTKVHALQRSSVATFPLDLVETVEFGSDIGNTSYIDLLVANLTSLETYYPYSQDEIPFLLHWNVDLDLRITECTLGFKAAAPFEDGSSVHQRFYEISQDVNWFSALNDLPWVQGATNNGWNTNQFAGQYIGRTLLASLLEETSEPYDYVLDLSGSGDSHTPVQYMKRQVIGYTPSVLVRAKGYLKQGDNGLSLEKVDVYDPETGTLSFDSNSDPVLWQISKIVLMAEALYVLEGYHTGIHLFSASMVSAMKKSLPAGSDIGEAVKPQTVLSIFAMFEEAALLHANHSSAFDGSVWPTESIYRVWEVTRDMARYYMDHTPEDFLGAGHSNPRPEWWAGMSQAFIAPIRKFAASVSTELVKSSSHHLEKFQAELRNVGLILPENNLDVTQQEGFARAFENMLFATSICHTHMTATREAFTPLLGWPSTAEFLPILTRAQNADGLDEGLSIAYPKVTDQLLSMFGLAYGTASGLSSKHAIAPQLGDGPYYGIADTPLADSVATFQSELATAREAVYNKFGPVKSGTFVPFFFYPQDMAKDLPFGFGITQTTYF